MGLDTGALGPRICDRSSRGHPGMGTRVSIHRTACLSDLVRQRPLSASRGETRCDTYRNRHPCTFGAEDSRLETSARRLTRKRTPPVRPADRQLHASHICIVARPGTFPNTGPAKTPASELGCRKHKPTPGNHPVPAPSCRAPPRFLAPPPAPASLGRALGPSDRAHSVDLKGCKPRSHRSRDGTQFQEDHRPPLLPFLPFPPPLPPPAPPPPPLLAARGSLKLGAVISVAARASSRRLRPFNARERLAITWIERIC